MTDSHLDRPERSDTHFLARQTKSLFISQLALLFMFFVCLALVGAVIMTSRKPQTIAVIDSSTGKNFGTVTRQYTDDLLEMNLVYYSKEFCENFYNANHADIDGARKNAVENMHPTLISKLKITTDFYNDSYVRNIKQNLGTCSFDWITIPHVTTRNDPRYTVFCQFRRLQNLSGKVFETKHNVIINWIRYKNIDPMKKPSPLFVLDFSDNDINSPAVKEQIELITR
ncbi:MAG: hypothetical protein JXB48_11055 [Candidatus Latescibacteria bacterium]|nr:hypothetical protein [Candidatus Latescibacterota bacterium]